MALPASGAITIGNVQTEFGGTNPAQMSEYYSGGARVPAGTTGGNGSDGVSAGTVIPTSGTLKLANFYNATATVATMTIGTANVSYVSNKIFDYYDSVVNGTQSNVNISVTSNISCRIQLFAGAGGPSTTSSGTGGGIQFTYTFTTGNTYTLALGLGGTTGGAGSPGGGAAGSATAGGGGGYSAIFVGTPSQSNIIAIAGGGGGAAIGTGAGQGGSGNTAGVSVPLNGLAGGINPYGGGGATGTAGGTGGTSTTVGVAGSALQGGSGVVNGTNASGGGGGGYFGGGSGGAASGANSGGGGGGSANTRLGATFEAVIGNATGANPRSSSPLSGRSGQIAVSGVNSYGSGLAIIGNWIAPYATGTVGSTIPATGYDYVLSSAINPGATSFDVVVKLTTSASSTAAESVLRFGGNYGRFFAGGTNVNTPTARSVNVSFTISGTTYTKSTTAVLQTTTSVNLTTTLGVAVPAGTVITVYVDTICVNNLTAFGSGSGTGACLIRVPEPRGTYFYIFTGPVSGGNTVPCTVGTTQAIYPIATIPAGSVIQRTATTTTISATSLTATTGTKAGWPGSIRITML